MRECCEQAASDRRYWLDRFTVDEIGVMTGAIWPNG
jgi:hypothetical protein